MEDNIGGENSVSIIDLEFHHMIDKKCKMGLNYNYLTITDNKYSFRIAHYLTNHYNDSKGFYTMINLTAESLHMDNFILCVDCGY